MKLTEQEMDKELAKMFQEYWGDMQVVSVKSVEVFVRCLRNGYDVPDEIWSDNLPKAGKEDKKPNQNL